METRPRLKAVLLFVSYLAAFVASASHERTWALPVREGLVSGASGKLVTLDEAVAGVAPGGVLILSEQHGNPSHYARQRKALSALHQTGRCVVSVGLEFLTWPYQQFNTPYLTGKISEAEFLVKAKWPGNPFADYRDQARFPLQTGGDLLSINAADALAKSIARVGIEGLTADETMALPPNWTLGSKFYRERFDVVMGSHVPASAMDRYFAAQSIRDETMAWRTVEFLRANPTHCVAIIVGDFHAAWGGGLPESLRSRGVSNLTVISQIEVGGWTDREVADEVAPHSRYGSRADFVWISETPPTPAP